jgi:hypothetical protein
MVARRCIRLIEREGAAVIERPNDHDDEYRVRPNEVRLLSIPEHRFVMVEGSGPAGGEAFEARMPGLYGVAYGLRSALKRRGVPGKVRPLEGLWWHAGGETDLNVILTDDRSAWRWTLMTVVPEEATEEEIEEHLAAGKAKVEPEIAASLRVESFEEGKVAQVLHVGPYAEERASIERLQAGIIEAGLMPRGRHHELYLGDPRRAAPDRLRTILRHPVES